MLGKSRTSAEAVPSTVSSTTVHGVLPHYGGHATASLVPAMTRPPAKTRASERKTLEPTEGQLSFASTATLGENRHPNESARRGAESGTKKHTSQIMTAIR